MIQFRDWRSRRRKSGDDCSSLIAPSSPQLAASVNTHLGKQTHDGALGRTEDTGE